MHFRRKKKLFITNIYVMKFTDTGSFCAKYFFFVPAQIQYSLHVVIIIVQI